MISDRLKNTIAPGDTSKEACARRLRMVRLALGMTQAEMGRLLGMSQNALAMKEAANSHPRPQHIQALFDALSVDHNFIYAGRAAMLPASLIEKLERVAAEGATD